MWETMGSQRAGHKSMPEHPRVLLLSIISLFLKTSSDHNVHVPEEFILGSIISHCKLVFHSNQPVAS